MCRATLPYISPADQQIPERLAALRVPRVVYYYWSTSSILSSLKPGSSDVVVDSLRDAKELPWREFLESSLTFRFCCLAVALARRLLLEPALEVGARREREG